MAKYNNDTYKEQIFNKYGEKFDLSEVNYINSYHKVKLRCIEHDETFLVDPIGLIRTNSNGNFCPKCNNNAKLTQSNFLNKIKKYENIYDLSKVNFTTTRNTVELTCLKHNKSFEVAARFLSCNTVSVHCPECKKEIEFGGTYTEIKKSEDAVFYKILVTHKESGLSFIKIGVTRKTTKQRYKGYKEFNIEVLEEVFDTGENVMKMEREYKQNNKQKRFHLPSTIVFNGRTECYIFDEEYQMKAKEVKFLRDEMLTHQNGICPLCKKTVEMPTLDHSHSKIHNGDGRIRGVLCNTCNRFIGVIENHAVRNNISFSELPEFLIKIAEYASTIRAPLIHPSEKVKEKKLSKKNYNKLAKLYKTSGAKAKFPEFPSSGKLTKPLEKLFTDFNIEPYN